MDCPHCRIPLAIAERQGIEVDYCPQCRGVWLDRGELDKIIDRSHRQFDTPPPVQAPPPQPYPQGGAYPQQGGAWGHRPSDHRPSDHRKDEHYGHHGHKHHKRKSFLDDIFDF